MAKQHSIATMLRLYAAWSEGAVESDVAAIEQAWKPDRRFTPKMTAAERDRRYAGWQDAVRRIRHGPNQDKK